MRGHIYSRHPYKGLGMALFVYGGVIFVGVLLVAWLRS